MVRLAAKIAKARRTAMAASIRFCGSSLAGWLMMGAITGSLIAGFAWAAGTFKKRLSPTDIVDLQEGDRPFAGFRRAHAKGICILGHFRSNGRLAADSRSSIFIRGRETPFVGRFSIGGANPIAPDLKAGVRSLAIDFRLANGERWRTAMNTPPVLAVRTPQAFFEQIAATKPDPDTGKPDADRLSEFNAAHPEGTQFRAWQTGYRPSGSWASERYHSINAFQLIDERGNKRAVRWRAEPNSDWVKPVSQSDNILQDELMDRLSRGSITFELIFSFASDADRIDDPSAAWPADRRQVKAGTIRIESAQVQRGGACDGINFDPLLLPDGIEPSADPILHARGSAYAVSYRRRALEAAIGAEQ